MRTPTSLMGDILASIGSNQVLELEVRDSGARRSVDSYNTAGCLSEGRGRTHKVYSSPAISSTVPKTHTTPRTGLDVGGTYAPVRMFRLWILQSEITRMCPCATIGAALLVPSTAAVYVPRTLVRVRVGYGIGRVREGCELRERLVRRGLPCVLSGESVIA